jgi:transposase
MCRIASLFLLQWLKGSMSVEVRNFNNINTQAVIKFLFVQGKSQKEIHAILTEALGEHAPSYATFKNWVTQFKQGDFSTCDATCPGQPKTVNNPEIIDQFHELILEDCRISAKSIAEQLGISRKRVGSITHEDLDMWNLSTKKVPRCLNGIKNVNGAGHLSNFWKFFGTIQMIS